MLKGSWVALVTPFKDDKIDFQALNKLIDFHLNNGTNGILFCGTTAESPALSTEEKDEIVKKGIEKINKKIPVMVGTGTNNIQKTICSTNRAAAMGADYALVITPYYNKPTQEGLYQFFKKVHDNTNISIVIYNVPGRTGVDIASETVVRLNKDCPRIVGIKEASGNLIKITELARDCNESFEILSGEDALNHLYICSGAVGTVSVTANVVPQMMSDLIIESLANNRENALELHKKLLKLNQAMFYETSPIPVKEALYKMGLIENEIRLPLVNISEKNKEKLHNVLREYNLI